MRANEETIKIYTLEREHESILPLIKEAFEKENISIRIQSKFDTAYDGIFMNQKGFGDIYVFKKDEERALIILNDILSEYKPE